MNFFKKINLLRRLQLNFNMRTQNVIRELNFLINDLLQPPAQNQNKILFSKKTRLDLEVAAVINKAQSFVFFAQLDFACEEIASALMEAIKRGVALDFVFHASMDLRVERPFTAARAVAGDKVCQARRRQGETGRLDRDCAYHRLDRRYYLVHDCILEQLYSDHQCFAERTLKTISS